MDSEREKRSQRFRNFPGMPETLKDRIDGNLAVIGFITVYVLQYDRCLLNTEQIAYGAGTDVAGVRSALSEIADLLLRYEQPANDRQCLDLRISDFRWNPHYAFAERSGTHWTDVDFVRFMDFSDDRESLADDFEKFYASRSQEVIDRQMDEEGLLDWLFIRLPDPPGQDPERPVNLPGILRNLSFFKSKKEQS